MNDCASYSLEKDLSRALEVLRAGGVILYPTDTIWGLGCDAANSMAVKRIYGIKRRDEAKSMITLLDSYDAVENFVADFPKNVVAGILSESTRPLTIVYHNPKGIAPELLAEDGSAAIRVTKEKFSNELCRRFGKPIVSTSANISGINPPSKFEDISEEVKTKVDYVVRYGRENKDEKEPSVIVKILRDDTIERIR